MWLRGVTMESYATTMLAASYSWWATVPTSCASSSNASISADATSSPSRPTTHTRGMPPSRPLHTRCVRKAVTPPSDRSYPPSKMAAPSAPATSFHSDAHSGAAGADMRRMLGVPPTLEAIHQVPSRCSTRYRTFLRRAATHCSLAFGSLRSRKCTSDVSLEDVDTYKYLPSRDLWMPDQYSSSVSVKSSSSSASLPRIRR
mmetsp:Transcript_39579/g.77372  ORF Transcript_39579/g.77372 Transcript_39579/m.77372 type:complete len:201 (-) Transcript_39579:872-1474(-)